MMKQSQPKMFRNDVILSAIRGYLLVDDFSDVHECLGHMAGHPLFTHELPSFFDEHQEQFKVFFPDLMEIDLSGVNQETVYAWVAEHQHFLNQTREVPVLQ